MRKTISAVDSAVRAARALTDTIIYCCLTLAPGGFTKIWALVQGEVLS